MQFISYNLHDVSGKILPVMGINIQKLEKEVKHLMQVEGKIAEAISLIEKSLPGISKKDKPKTMTALAHCYFYVGKTQKAINLYNEAYKLAQSTKNKLVESDILRKLAYVLWKTKRNKNISLNLAKASLKITNKYLQKKEFKKVSASAWAAVGNIEEDSGQINKALGAYKKGLSLARSTDFIERESTILGDLGSVSIKKGRFKEAEAYLLEAENIGREKCRHELPAALLRLGYLYSDKRNSEKNLNKAKEYFKKSLKVALTEGWRREQADACFALGKLKNDDELLKKAKRIYDKIGYS